MDKKIKYVLVNGYGCTGSSAVVDLLREYENVIAPQNEKEFRLIKDPFGIIDLDRALNDSIDMSNEDIAIKNFKWMTDKYIKSSNRFGSLGLGYLNDYGNIIREATDRYIESLIDKKYKSYWWFYDMNSSAIEYFFKRVLRKLGIKDLETYQDTYICVKTEEEFIQLTKKYINEIFGSLVKQGEEKTIILDQAIPATHPRFANRYFSNPLIINVERDPRDVYVNLLKKKLLVGYSTDKTHDPALFIEWYLKARKTNEDMRGVLKVNFEDIVLKYNETKEKISQYVGVYESDHTRDKVYFDPNVSIKDVGLWRKYVNYSELKMIESELKEYLYNI